MGTERGMEGMDEKGREGWKIAPKLISNSRLVVQTALDYTCTACII